ncbi:MAG: lysostaphin resistance A-like protein [Chitinophagales bacterium]
MRKQYHFIKSLQVYATQYPIIFSGITIAVFTLFTEAIGFESVLKHFDKQSTSYLSGILVQGLASIFLVVLLKGLGLLKSAGFTKPNEWKQLWMIWPIVVLCILVSWPLIDGTLHIDTSKSFVIILYILVYLSTGFYEEILFRGVTLTVMVRRWGAGKSGLYLAAVLSSVMFGGLHIISLFLGRISLMASVTQVLYATFIGTFFAACVLRNKSIWPAIFFHALFNICSDWSAISIGSHFGQISNINNTFADALSTILVFLPFFIYGLFILRKVQPLNSESLVKQSEF